MEPPLSVLELEGCLQLTDEAGQSIEFMAEGGRLRAEVGAVTLRRPTLRLVRSSVVFARRLSRALERQSLTLVVTRDGKPVAELGAGVAGGPAARLLRMPRVRLYRRL